MTQSNSKVQILIEEGAKQKNDKKQLKNNNKQ